MFGTSDQYYFGVYWKARKESIDQCAQRLEDFFSNLRNIDSRLLKLRPVLEKESDQADYPSQREYLKYVLEQGVNQNDVGGEVIPDLGYSATFVGEGDSQPAISIKLTCCVYSEWNSNACVIYIPKEKALESIFLEQNMIRDLFKQLVKCWNPDHGRLTNFELEEELMVDGEYVDVGCVTYRSNRLGLLPVITEPSWMEDIDKNGYLIFAVEDLVETSKGSLVKALNKIASVFGDKATVV